MKVMRFPFLASVLIVPFLLALGLVAATTPRPVQGAPDAVITVTNLNDSGPGSLRQAINDANPGETIEFSVSGTIVLSRELIISSSLTIDGGGAITVSGNNAVRVFNVMSGNVVFDGLTIAQGNVQTLDCASDPGYQCGGGIIVQNDSVVLTVTNSVVTGNQASYGGGLYLDGGAVLVHNSTFAGNEVSNEGGAIYNYHGLLTIANSTILTNSAQYGGGLLNWTAVGDCFISVATMIVNSTFSGNVATESGGGIYHYRGLLEITHSTVANNTAAAGSGVWSDNDENGCARVGHTVIAGNIGDDVAAGSTVNRFHSLGHNLIGTAGGTVDFDEEFNEVGDQTGIADPKLGPLADNGGPTLTHLPLPDSPAVDAGAPTCAVATDQRGVARPQGAACDIGAVELDYAVFLPLIVR